ncbi:Oidioi.mRNA.OKI2018_I69.XSR.g16117.t1.cds [Oikopleura dioica]|uniref:Oidioi.mRNA.OKI2018_I69.XSR.g16117.t1.cds n=1 Tax=Oikopleura dioica TaxID=34765 RepID=A0ABN7SME9_OIKDI|nr:Oidioi.mRNA.OKI2018_I69.XSR.g16117.t1.cds [Oikopleura dioica]
MDKRPVLASNIPDSCPTIYESGFCFKSINANLFQEVPCESFSGSLQLTSRQCTSSGNWEDMESFVNRSLLPDCFTFDEASLSADYDLGIELQSEESQAEISIILPLMLSISLCSLLATAIALVLMRSFLNIESPRVFVHFNLLIAFFFRSAVLLLGYFILARTKTRAHTWDGKMLGEEVLPLTYDTIRSICLPIQQEIVDQQYIERFFIGRDFQ